MKNVLLFLLLVTGCGSGTKPVAVLPAVEDFSVPIIIEDMSKLPPDLYRAPCTNPDPGLYMEYSQGTYTTSQAAGPYNFQFNATVIVKNDGSFIKVEPSSFNVLQFLCDNPQIDPMTCTAPCCSGAAAPILYFAGDGWRLITPGSCTRNDPANANLSYFYQVTYDTGAQ